VHGERSHGSTNTDNIYMNSQRWKELSSPQGHEPSFEPPSYPHAFMVGHVPPQETPEQVALAAHGDARQLVRLVQCPQCSKPFSAPVTLPCGHTVCRGCLPAPVPRPNISYPNTPDRLRGIVCPLPLCCAEHAAAECSVDVTLTKLMELIKVEVANHRPSSIEDTPTLLKEIVQWDEGMAMEEKEKMQYEGHSRVLHGGRLVSTFTMAEMGELRYRSDVEYQTMSASGDNYQSLDVALLERLREVAHKELDCLVCYNMMLDPTTTSCGHTFCRRCLVRAMDHSNICPMCRAALHIPPSLQNKGSNTLLNSLLHSLCPDLVAARRKALEAEEQAGNDALDTPLFVCTLALPNMPTFLHVFEPRYRLMMRRCAEGNRQFGMVMYNQSATAQGDLGTTQFVEYGTLLEIISLELLRDGRSFVETRGIGRFRIRDHGMLDGYHVGRVERVEDVSLAEEGALEQSETVAAQEMVDQFRREHPELPLPGTLALNLYSTQQLLDRCMAFVRDMRNQSAPWLSARIVAVYGEPPDDPALFPYWFASVLPIAPEEKYVLLRTTRVRQRLKIVFSWIARIQGQRL
jgi:Lon protease-like protein